MNIKNNYSNRPQYHFTPKTGWMNDPNGLVYYDNFYHLFYQYVPDKMTHSNNLHWGHATSRDLFNWTHKDMALKPDKNGSNWSGSVVLDWTNTGDFQSGKHITMVALYTQAVDHIQHQSLAYSSNSGDTWSAFENNPVIENPEIRDFRDPKVFWFESSNSWKMVLAAGDRILVYESVDLRKWDIAGEFILKIDYPNVVCECPDLFEMHFEESPEESRWIMLVSLSSGGPNGGSGTVYFIGSFDGKRFVPDPPNDIGRWLDYGKDFYAAVTFSDIPPKDGRRILMAWMNNWEYAEKLPTRPWMGMMTLARELSLLKGENGSPGLKSAPVSELKQLRKNRLSKEQPEIKNPWAMALPTDSGQALEIFINYQNTQKGNLEILFNNEKHDSIKIICDHQRNEILIDRSGSENPLIHDQFARGAHSAPLSGNRVSSLHVFIDCCSIEIFVDDGYSVISSLVFPQRPYSQMRLSCNNNSFRINNLEMWRLN